jgi:phage terminase large subunit
MNIAFIKASKVCDLDEEQTELLCSAFRANGQFPIIANDVYIENRFRPEFIQLVYGGSGGGKSDWKALELLLKCLTDKYRRILFTRKVKETIRMSQFQLFKDLIKRYKMDALFHVVDNRMEIRCKHNGNMMFGAGLYDVDRITSVAELTDIWIEEPIDRKGSITRDDLRELRRRLRTKKASCHIHMTFNPISSASWIYTDFFQSNDYKPFILKTTYKDNYYCPAWKHDEFEIEKKNDPEGYRVYGLGEWGKLKKGLIFPEIEIVESMPTVFKRRGVGLDWGFFPDPTAAVDCGMIDGRLYLDELIYRTGLNNEKRAKALIESGVPFDRKIVADRNPEAISDLKTFGFKNIVPAKKGPGSIKAGIDIMKKYKILVTRRSENIIAEFSNYEWETHKHSNDQTGEPIDAWNHAIDGARYWVTEESTTPEQGSRSYSM